MLNIKDFRIEKNILQKDLALFLNRTPTCISDWERGKREPSVEDLIKLADFFGCSVDYLIGRESEDFQIIGFGNELSKDENQLLDTLRQLSPLRKEVVYKIANVLLQEQASEKNK